MAAAETPSLAWVLVAGAPRHVSDFAQMPLGRRPRAYCPQCARTVTLKLGTVRRHHAAHASGAQCAATQPETALHLGCKLALAATLRDACGPGAALTTVQRCAGAGDDACTRSRTIPWARAWDAVQVEYRVGESRRPDIVLCRDDTPIAAIEIVVSNAISAEKARALAALGVPWIEVAATEAMASPNAWSLGMALEIRRADDVGEWRCDVHACRHAAEVDAAVARQSATRETERRTTVLRAARVVDLYHDRGARERLIYRVTDVLFDGRLRDMRLQCGTIEVLTVETTPDRTALRSAWTKLRIAFVADTKRRARNEHTFADSPMRWATGDAAENIVDEALLDRVGRDPTPLATRLPRRWFFAKNTGRWFLPANMRDVSWDREPLDPFMAHPAWYAARGAVRERPAPDGSWSTPIFAARPLAAMFGRDAVVRRVDDAITVVALTTTDGAQSSRVIAVIERAAPAETIESVARSLGDDGLDVVWLSHPRDWSPPLARLVWAPAGRDQYGNGAVLVDEMGVYRAERFARALANGDRRLDGPSIKRLMAARVVRMETRG